MKRIFIAGAVAALFACATAVPWSANAQTGGGGASGGAGASGASGTSGAAGASSSGTTSGTSSTGTTGSANTSSTGAAGASGTTGTSPATGTTGATTGTGTVAGQNPTGTTGAAGATGAANTRTGTNANVAVPGQPGTGTTLNAQGQLNVPATTSQAPFFANATVQQELGLNQNQINQLNQAHQAALTRFNQGVVGLDANLTPDERALRIQQLQATFNTEFGGTLGTTFTDPAIQQRFNQLNLQSQGFAAFQDPTVMRQLNITPDQRNQLRQLSGEWRQQLNDLRTAARSNPALSEQQLADLQTQFWQQVNTILNPQQQQAWAQLAGQRFNFPSDVFLPQTSANVNAQGTVGVQQTTGFRGPGTGQNNATTPATGQNNVPQTGSTQTQPQGTVR